MTLIGRKILLTNTDASGNPTLDFPITSIECVEGGASQEDLDTTNNTLAENTTNLQEQLDIIRNNVSYLASTMSSTAQVVDYEGGSYITFSNGFQIVMGTEKLDSSFGYDTFVFPKPFLVAPIVVGIPISSTTVTPPNLVIHSTPTPTSVEICCSTKKCSFYYIAIGIGAVVL